MSEEVEHLVGTAQEHGLTVAIGVAGMYAAKRVFGPSLDVIGRRFAEVAEASWGNLGAIFNKVPPTSEAVFPHPRTALKVLNDAFLYDDDIMQTYVAGMIAGSRNSDGSDDRPVFYLSMLDRMTAAQTHFFHAMFSAVSQSGMTDETLSFVGVNASEVEEHVGFLAQVEPAYESQATAAVLGVESLGLVQHVGVKKTQYFDRHLSFFPTALGMLLFDWVHGFSDDDYRSFFSRVRPDLGLPQYAYKSLSLGIPS